jgi:S1-C subfamily serine protease
MAHDVLHQISTTRARRIASVAPRALALRLSSRHSVSAILWRDHFLVTASDALRGADPVHVVGPEGEGRVDFAGADTTVDVAVLKLDPAAAASSAPALASAAPETGATIALVGRSTDGVLAAWGGVKLNGEAWTSQRGGRIDRRIELDVSFERRLEGALVVDTGGAAVGMSVPGPRGRVLCISAATIERVVSVIETHGHVPQPFIGICLQPLWIDAATGRELDLPNDMRSVPVVSAIESGSPAAAAGLQVGDWLLAADDSPLSRPQVLPTILAGKRPGEPLELTVRRGAVRQAITIQVGERPR